MSLQENNKVFMTDIVLEPRSVTYSVEGYNAEALGSLVSIFGQFEQNSCPRLQPVPSVQQVSSPYAGFGKSHLLGRLFKTLKQRATLVYVRPFQDPSAAFVSILEQIVLELELSDQAVATSTFGALANSQLEVLTRCVLEKLVERLVFDGVIAPPTVGAQGHKSAAESREIWKQWFSKNFKSLLPVP